MKNTIPSQNKTDFLSAIKIEEIYRHGLKSVVEISKHLGLWQALSTGEQESLKKLDQPVFQDKFNSLTDQQVRESLEDSLFWELEGDKLVYGEITKKGANKLAQYLHNFSGNFYDIGSGNGKLLLHLALLTNFSHCTGVEILEVRHRYALSIRESLGVGAEFICADILDVDISAANFLFLDDLMFPLELRQAIYQKIPHNCYFLTAYSDVGQPLEIWPLAVSWQEFEMNFYLYKKS